MEEFVKVSHSKKQQSIAGDRFGFIVLLHHRCLSHSSKFYPFMRKFPSYASEFNRLDLLAD